MATDFQNAVDLFSVLFGQILESKKDYKRGLLGNSSGVIEVPGRPDFVWIREDEFSDKARQVFNKRVLGVEPDTPVLIGELPWQPGLVQVVGVDWQAYARMDWSATYSAVPAHNVMHQYPSEASKGPDAVNIYMPAIQPLKSTADNVSLNVTVQPYTYFYRDTFRKFLGNVLDLTSYLPSAGTAKYILIYLDKTTNLLSIVSGSEVTDSTAITPPKPELPDNGISSCFIRLSNGQTSISSTTGIIDARELLNTESEINQLIGLALIHLENNKELTVPVTHQMVVHEDDLTIDGDLTLNGNLIFDTPTLTEVPAYATGTGYRGQWALSSEHLYFCYTENQWKRTPISTW